MTGYGYREFQDEELQAVLEIKSYNNRYLDLVINVSNPFSPFEPKLREFFLKRIMRGRVEVYCKIKLLKQDLEIHVDEGNAAAYADALRTVAKTTGLPDELHLSHLLRMEGILSTETTVSIERYWERISDLLSQTFTEYEQSRIREGEATRESLQDLTRDIEGHAKIIEAAAPRLEGYIKETVQERFKELLGDEYDENRVMTEIAALLLKYSINEELVRLQIHLSSFRESIESDGQGKKLDFICQEMNREINTIGSKSSIIEINQHVVEIKDGIEKIREQLRNIE
jgi:uncharacterized protein (TIGR00255 family)